MRKLTILFFVIVVLSACGTGKPAPTENTKKPSDSLLLLNAEMTEGDFLYRLFSEKTTYRSTDDFAIYAELTYIGEQDAIDIYHAASPFSFPIGELTRGIKVDYAMNLPLLTTTLKKGEPMREKYQFAGGYSDQDEKEYVDFIKTIMDGVFPEGEYRIYGSADFYIEDPANASNEETFNLKADIGFSVKE